MRLRYGSRQALDGLDLTVPAGAVYGFLGPNVAGKATTMRLLMGLLQLDAGTIDRRLLFDVRVLVETPLAGATQSEG